MFIVDLLSNALESIYDNVFRDKVFPVNGSIVYCELLFGYAEHSGVYIGDGIIVHLDGSGKIEMVTHQEFLDRLGGLNSAVSIYVSCNYSLPVGDAEISIRAKSMVGKERDYNILLDNCHQFTSGCITGDFENSDNFLFFLKHTAKNKLNANTWRVWER
jgi:hypothetical protein